MKSKLFLITFLAFCLLSCTKTGEVLRHYVDNRLTEDVTVAFTLDTTQYYSSTIERPQSFSQVIPAGTKHPVSLPAGYRCYTPAKNYRSFVVLNADGDTILDATPMDVTDNSAWKVECETETPDRYTKIFVINYILAIDNNGK